MACPGRRRHTSTRAEGLVGVLEAVQQRGHDARTVCRTGDPSDGAPFTFSLSTRCRGGGGGDHWAAKASLISTRSMSSIVMPARLRSGDGLDRAEAHDLGLSRSRRSHDACKWVIPSWAALVSLMTTTAAAPSFRDRRCPRDGAPHGTRASAARALERGARRGRRPWSPRSRRRASPG